MELPEGIVVVDYSESQRCFHFESDPLKHKGNSWIRLKPMSIDDANTFCDFMDRKYVNGRVTGILPEFNIVKLEMDLFFELKKSRRKLAGRV